MIIQRYLLKLIWVPFVLITGLLTVLLLAEVFSEVLTRALGGFLPGSVVALLIVLQVPALLLELMPGAFFLATVIALGQLSASSERVVMQAVGFSDGQILWLLIRVAASVMLVLWLVALWLAPWASRQVAEVEQMLASRPAAELVQPGEFANIGLAGSTLYARSSDPKSGDLTQVFVAYLTQGEQRLLTSERARVEWVGGSQYLTLLDGEMVRTIEPERQLEKTRFATLQLRLQTPTVNTFTPRDGKTLSALWRSSNLRDRTIAQQRLMNPITLLVFSVWAMALTRYRPRMGKNAAILPAVVVYVLFTYLSRTIDINVYNGALPLWANYWWLQVLLILLGLLWMRFDLMAQGTLWWHRFRPMLTPLKAPR